MTIAITVDASEVVLALQAIDRNLDDFSKPFAALGELVLSDGRGQIVSQGRVFGAGWGQMSPLTPVVATRLYGRGRDPNTLLQDERGLIDSLEPGGPANIFEIGKLDASFGSSYSSQRTGFAVAKYQQEGTARTYDVLGGGRRGLVEGAGYPPRPFLEFLPERSDEYLGLFAEHVLEGA